MNKELKTIDEVKALVDDLSKESTYIFDVRELPNDGGFTVQWQPHKKYVAQDGKEYPDEVWFTLDGDMKQIQDLSEDHCRNILRMILRQDRESKNVLDEIVEKITDAAEYGCLFTSDLEESAPPILH